MCDVHTHIFTRALGTNSCVNTLLLLRVIVKDVVVAGTILLKKKRKIKLSEGATKKSIAKKHQLDEEHNEFQYACAVCKRMNNRYVSCGIHVPVSLSSAYIIYSHLSTFVMYIKPNGSSNS